MTALSTALAARSGRPGDSLLATLSGFPPALYATFEHPEHHAPEVPFVMTEAPLEDTGEFLPGMHRRVVGHTFVSSALAFAINSRLRTGVRP